MKLIEIFEDLDMPERGEQLSTNRASYESAYVGEVYYRVVCEQKNPQLEKKGMILYDVSEKLNDPELKGYFGVHVGDPNEWLPHLVDDEYCFGNAYIYEIEIPNNIPFFVTHDPNSGGYAGEYNDVKVPEGEIIFTNKVNKIPATSVFLHKSIPSKQLKGRDDY